MTDRSKAGAASITPLIAALGLAAGCSVQTEVEDGAAITQVTIVDLTTGSLQRAMTVAISGTDISVVAPSSSVRLGPEVRTIDGTGRFLIPGLWDMHVHVFGSSSEVREVELPLYIANGITGVRLMSADCDSTVVVDSSLGGCISETSGGWPTARDVAGWKRAIGAGQQVGPRIVASSVNFEGPRARWPVSYRLTDPMEGRQRVREARARGADFIKILTSLPADVYFAVADEAKEIGIPFEGHPPLGMSFTEVAQTGQRSVEHLHMRMLEECSTAPDDLNRARERSREERSDSAQYAYLDLLFESFDAQACLPMFEALRKHGTAFTPTNVLFEPSMADFDLDAALADERLRYLPAQMRQYWLAYDDRRLELGYLTFLVVDDLGLAHRSPSLDPALTERFDRLSSSMNQVLAAMADAGVTLLAGSDAGGPFVYPGFSLHDELRALVDAGLTPLDALRAATLNPAAYFGRQDELGTVSPGKLADLVLLDANPLEDIGNTRTVTAVIADGRLFDRADLDHLLQSIASAAE